MGPPSLDGGERIHESSNPPTTPGLQWGPRLSTGGRPTPRWRRPSPASCFNGAPVSRRGGGARGRHPQRPGEPASMGPPSLDGGEAGVEAGVERGAAVASMGPPSLDGGECSRRSSARNAGPRFNGAPVSRRGGGLPYGRVVGLWTRLQWGPRLSTGGR